jgi:hypothetical protein
MTWVEGESGAPRTFSRVTTNLRWGQPDESGRRLDLAPVIGIRPNPGGKYGVLKCWPGQMNVAPREETERGA